MKILLIGKNGQVGWELQRALAPLGELIALDRYGNEEFAGDISDFSGIETAITTIQPTVVVNASAYTDVDKAEVERQQAWLINAEAVGSLARACKTVNALLVHYSTDYVFDGAGMQAHTEDEDEPTSPVNYYGASKLEGEKQIAAAGCNHLIFRTSWVYAARGDNFIKTILKLAKINDELTIINDQIGAPTSAALIADVTAHAICHYAQHATPTTLNGIYHLVASGVVSWFEYAQFFIDAAKKAGIKLEVQNVLPIETADYPTSAKRPLNSRLSTKKIQSTFNLTLPPWQQGVSHVLNEILSLTELQ